MCNAFIVMTDLNNWMAFVHQELIRDSLIPCMYYYYPFSTCLSNSIYKRNCDYQYSRRCLSVPSFVFCNFILMQLTQSNKTFSWPWSDAIFLRTWKTSSISHERSKAKVKAAHQNRILIKERIQTLCTSSDGTKLNSYHLAVTDWALGIRTGRLIYLESKQFLLIRRLAPSAQTEGHLHSEKFW